MVIITITMEHAHKGGTKGGIRGKRESERRRYRVFFFSITKV
jgi:hypothetical protein